MKHLNLKKGKPSEITAKSAKVAQSENSSQYVEEEDDSNQNSEDKDFGLVPVNNLDNKTVHIRFEDEPKYLQESRGFLLETDTENLNNAAGGY